MGPKMGEEVRLIDEDVDLLADDLDRAAGRDRVAELVDDLRAHVLDLHARLAHLVVLLQVGVRHVLAAEQSAPQLFARRSSRTRSTNSLSLRSSADVSDSR